MKTRQRRTRRARRVKTSLPVLESTSKTRRPRTPQAALTQLQQQCGNRAIQRMAESGVLQAKFGIGPLQRKEKEEEPVQKKAEEEEPLQKKKDEEEPLQKKVLQRAAKEEEEPLQKKEKEEEPLQKREGSQQTTTSTPNSTGMPARLKGGLEGLSGYDMSDVKVHYNSPNPAQVGALAYTQGNDIHVAPGQERHLPHEGWHVVQQKQGRVKPTLQAKGLPINNDPSLEKEADQMGYAALTEKSSNSSGKPHLTGNPITPSLQRKIAKMRTVSSYPQKVTDERIKEKDGEGANPLSNYAIHNERLYRTVAGGPHAEKQIKDVVDDGEHDDSLFTERIPCNTCDPMLRGMQTNWSVAYYYQSRLYATKDIAEWAFGKFGFVNWKGKKILRARKPNRHLSSSSYLEALDAER